jgi:autotransporter-associated beta strand protein
MKLDDAIGLYVGGTPSTACFETASESHFWTYRPLTLARALTGTGRNVYKFGTDVLILTSANTYTGTTNISAGSLQLGTGGTTGSLNPASVINNAGTLIFNRSDTVIEGVDFYNTLSGSGSVIKTGIGTLILSGTNTHTGSTTISSGNITYQGAASMSNGSKVAMLPATTLNLRADSDTIFTPGVGSFAFTASPAAYNINVNSLNSPAGDNRILTIGRQNGTSSTTAFTTINVNSTTGDTLQFQQPFQLGSTGTGGVGGDATGVTTPFTTFVLTNANVILSGGISETDTNLDAGIAVVSPTNNTLTLSGKVITNTNRTIFIRAGLGSTVNLNNTLSLAGGTNTAFFAYLSGGNLNINKPGVISSNFNNNIYALRLISGTLNNNSGAAITMTTNPQTRIEGDFSFGDNTSTSANSLNLGTSFTHLSGGPSSLYRTITVNGAATLTFGGLVSSAGVRGITKDGTGTLTLSGPCYYTGNTAISSGLLRIGKAYSAPGNTIGSIEFTNNNLSATFIGAPGPGDIYQVFAGATSNTYPVSSITLVNSSLSATYNSSNSTITMQTQAGGGATTPIQVGGNTYISGTNAETWTNWYSVSTVNGNMTAFGAISSTRTAQGVLSSFQNTLYISLSTSAPFYFVTSNQDTTSTLYGGMPSTGDRFTNYWVDTNNKPCKAYTNQNNTIYPITSGQRSAVSLNVGLSTANKLSFSTPVSNVCVAFMSLGATYSTTNYYFDQDFTVVSTATAASDARWNFGTQLNRVTATLNGNTYYLLSGAESDGIIKFNSNSLSAVNWIVTNPESWCSIQVAATPIIVNTGTATMAITIASQAGGGGGAGYYGPSQQYDGAGGGGGGFSIQNSSVQTGEILTVTVGTGGAPGTGANGNIGQTGGLTYVTSSLTPIVNIVVANGGQGASNNTPGQGGIGTTQYGGNGTSSNVTTYVTGSGGLGGCVYSGIVTPLSGSGGGGGYYGSAGIDGFVNISYAGPQRATGGTYVYDGTTSTHKFVAGGGTTFTFTG